MLLENLVPVKLLIACDQFRFVDCLTEFQNQSLVKFWCQVYSRPAFSDVKNAIHIICQINSSINLSFGLGVDSALNITLCPFCQYAK